LWGGWGVGWSGWLWGGAKWGLSTGYELCWGVWTRGGGLFGVGHTGGALVGGGCGVALLALRLDDWLLPLWIGHDLLDRREGDTLVVAVSSGVGVCGAVGGAMYGGRANWVAGGRGGMERCGVCGGHTTLSLVSFVGLWGVWVGLGCGGGGGLVVVVVGLCGLVYGVMGAKGVRCPVACHWGLWFFAIVEDVLCVGGGGVFVVGGGV